MTVTEDDIIYSYGKIREQMKDWIDGKHNPTINELSNLLSKYPSEVGEED